jgi:dTDP-4-amino-4,6-dideoxygalactose transaminase
VATAAAAEMCGYRPLLVDVDETTWTLRPDSIEGHPLRDRIGLVLPVAPLGRPILQQPWVAFRDRTAIPVVIDAAASFDLLECLSYEERSAYLGSIPIALSFHATKVFSCSEGGAVAASDRDLLSRARRALNFGFLGSRDSVSPGFNGKLSEYHAAVGLAYLDEWPTKRRDFERVARTYRERAEALGCGGRIVVSPDVALCYAICLAREPREREAVEAALVEARIAYRKWYGDGLHRQHRFMGFGTCDAAERVASVSIGLPVAADLSEDEISRVVEAVAVGIRRGEQNE